MKQSIETASAKVLEDWSMMLVEPFEGNIDALCGADDLLVTSVNFRGPFSGEFSIACKNDFALEILDNLIGESDPSEEEVKDCLLELINVLGGNLLTECYGADLVFDLINPKVEPLKPTACKLFFDNRTFYFLLDDHPVALRFSLKE
jgi:CheY-specific phosphatase CheX